MSLASLQRMLGDPARAGVYHLPAQGAPQVLAAAESAGLALCHVDLLDAADKDAFFERIAAALEFPDWFGRNWDALQDCLTDLSWLPAAGYVVILEHCDGFRADQGEDFAMALQIFDAAADYWRGEGAAFWTLVDMHADGIAYLPDLA